MKRLNLIVILASALSSTLLAQEPKPVGPSVQLSLIVTDSKDKSLNAITKEDVHLVEDKVEQTVLSVAPDQRPVDLGIAVDASGSMRRLIDSNIEAAKLIVVNRQPKDEIFLERFVSTGKVQRLHDFSTDVKSLTAALDSILVEGGQSAVIDAIYTGAQYVGEHNPGADRRKVLVVITDGEDRNSRMKLDELVKLLHENGVQVFIVGLTVDLDKESSAMRVSPRDKAEKLLKTLAEETGGRAFFPRSKDDLNDSVAQIVHDLHGQFRITYQSSNAELKGFRKIEVKLNPADGQKRKAIVQNVTTRHCYRNRRVNMNRDRRDFLSRAGKSLGLAALTTPTIGALLKEVEAASRSVAHLTPEQVAMDEDYWSVIQNSFTVTRGIVNLNNGGVSPSPRIVTEALVRYIWQQEDATAYTMWQLLEPQSETIRTGLAEMFGVDREEIAITRNASESLEILLMGMDFKPGDEILTTTQDYPRMLTTLRQRERREGLVLKMVKIPIPPRNLNEITAAFEKGITSRTKLILMSHQVNITGQITPVKAVCELARSKGIETIVDGAHSYAQFDFKQKDLGCDYFGTSLHKWLYAPKGTGLLYVRRDKIEKLWPLMAAESKQSNDIRKFEEIGTHSAAPRLAIGEALLFHNGIGGKRKEARLRYLSRYWMNRLKNVPKVSFNTSFDPEQSCAIANVNIAGIDPTAIGSYLFNKHRVFTTPIVHEEFKGIRITPNVYTTLNELDRFCNLMESIARNGLPT